MNRLIICLALIIAPLFASTADARPRLFQRGPVLQRPARGLVFPGLFQGRILFWLNLVG